MDNIKYKNELESAHPEYGVSVESTKSWSSGGLFLGPYLRFPLSEKLSWDVRALAGFFGSYSPKATIRAKEDKPNAELETYYVESSRATSFSYLLGTGFKYRIGSYYVLLFGDYVSSNLKFKNASGWDWDGEPYTTSFNQKINYLSVTAGVGYIL